MGDEGAGVEVGANVRGEAAARVVGGAQAPRARVESRAPQGEEDATQRARFSREEGGRGTERS